MLKPNIYIASCIMNYSEKVKPFCLSCIIIVFLCIYLFSVSGEWTFSRKKQHIFNGMINVSHKNNILSICWFLQREKRRAEFQVL